MCSEAALYHLPNKGRFWIKCCGNFIEQHDVRVHRQRAGNGNSLLLTTREFSRVTVFFALQTHFFYQLFGHVSPRHRQVLLSTFIGAIMMFSSAVYPAFGIHFYSLNPPLPVSLAIE